MKSFARSECGATLPIMASLMLLTTAGGALAVDVARAYALRSEMQGVADSAALAAAIMLPDMDAARQAARRTVQRSFPDDPDMLRAEDFDFGYWEASNRRIVADDHIASAVRVTVRRAESRKNGISTLFAGFLGNEIIDAAASAVAGKRGVACLIALGNEDRGLELNGNAELELNACGAQVNSNKKEAFKAGDKIVMISDGICVTGGIKIDRGADIMPVPTEGCPPHIDPLADVTMPAFGGCTDHNVEYKDEAVILTPDRVFCDGLRLSGSARVTLQPGLYVIDDGEFEVEEDAILEGDGVTILLHGEKAEMDIKGDAVLRLKAPTSGPMKGLLIIQDEGSLKDNKWDSKAMSELTGVVYLPDGKFTSRIEANITGTDACFVLIANKVKIDGNAKMSIDLSSTACRNSLPTAFSRSVALFD